MKYFLDTEFIEYPNTIELISVALVHEDGKSIYAENADCDYTKAGEWVNRNVIPNLLFKDGNRNFEKAPDNSLKIKAPLKAIESLILGFIGCDKPIFYGYYSAYDWVVFCWIFGSMVELPKGWPMYCRDLKQLADGLNKPRFEGPKNKHNALTDARWNKEFYEYLIS